MTSATCAGSRSRIRASSHSSALGANTERTRPAPLESGGVAPSNTTQISAASSSNASTRPSSSLRNGPVHQPSRARPASRPTFSTL